MIKLIHDYESSKSMILVEENNSTFSYAMTTDEINNLRREINKTFYIQDIYTHLEDNYKSDIFDNQNLIDDMIDFYTDHRENHDTGSSDYEMTHWTESINITITHFQNALRPYELD